MLLYAFLIFTPDAARDDEFSVAHMASMVSPRTLRPIRSIRNRDTARPASRMSCPGPLAETYRNNCYETDTLNMGNPKSGALHTHHLPEQISR
jgi:hypothetical protein